jgi:hypothetical protein
MQAHRNIFDSAITAMTEHLCGLLGVECNDQVLAHWQTKEGQEALRLLLPQLQLCGARALTLSATGPVAPAPAEEKAIPSPLGGAAYAGQDPAKPLNVNTLDLGLTSDKDDLDIPSFSRARSK